MLYHAETHFLKGEDFDRRIALISFDNAILREKVEAEKRKENAHIREVEKDRAIDAEHGMTDIAGISYYTSEILFNIDYQAYKEIGEELLSLQEPDEKNTEDS